MAGKGLGTGLGALFGNAAGALASEFEYIRISEIEPRAEQPRVNFDEDKLEELSDSIREHGVLQPLTVREIEAGVYQIIAGERRWRAARLAGLAEVPARIITADDKKATELALIENLQRENLNPIEEAQGYKRLIDEHGLTQEEVSERVSKSRPAVANALRLLALPEDVKSLVSDGVLPAGGARALLSLKSENDMVSAASVSAGKGMSVREIEKFVKYLKRQTKMKYEEEGFPQVDYVRQAQDNLALSLGRRVRIIHNSEKGRGRIEIDYYNPDDFDLLYEAILKVKSTGL